jgi:hypothetical protein
VERDRFGLGWRPELAAGILAHADRIDVVELIADDHFDAGRSELRALRTLARARPVLVHGVSLGLASCAPAERRRLQGMARLVGFIEPVAWSEHLAFVRAGGREIGHLAAPPRNAATLEGLACNVERASLLVGSRPLLENVATLIEPPGSDRDEADFVRAAITGSGAGLLLDLHNLHANAVNFGFDALAALDALPLDRVGAVHLAGGRLVAAPDGGRRLLDDHLHPVPYPVYTLLEELARRCRRPLTVILERDGRYPPMAELLSELQAARDAVARGRASRRAESRVA